MADGMMTAGASGIRPTRSSRVRIGPAQLRETARAVGLGYPMHLASCWAGTERRRRAAGDDRQAWARHAARHICQGIIGDEDAALALVLIEYTLRERDAAPVPNDPAGDLAFARFILAQAVASEEAKRSLLAKKMRDAIAPMLRRLVPSVEMMQALRQMNDEGGKLFVWPQLRQLLEQEIHWHLKRTKRDSRGRQHA